MTDENKRTSDDEYQFPQDEYIAGDETHDADTSYDYAASDDVAADDGEYVSETSFKDKLAGILKRHPMLQNKRVIGVVVVAIMALIGFKIMSPSHTVKKVKTATVQTMSPEQQEQNLLLSKLNALSKETAKNRNTADQLQSQVSNVQSALSASSKDNEAMKNAVIELARQVQNLSQEVKAENAKPKKHSKYPPPPVITYHLIALESGRAWIMGSNGISNSVKVGTKIKHYGAVKAIEPNIGKVLTTSGKVISYNADGN